MTYNFDTNTINTDAFGDYDPNTGIRNIYLRNIYLTHQPLFTDHVLFGIILDTVIHEDVHKYIDESFPDEDHNGDSDHSIFSRISL